MTSVSLSSPDSPQRRDHGGGALVDRQQRLGAAPVVAAGPVDLLRRQRLPAGERRRLVGDVGLVEARRLGEGLGVERPGVADRRLGGVVAAELRLRRRVVGRSRVRREVGDGEEEGLIGRRPLPDQVDRLLAVHVGGVGGRIGGVVGVLVGVAVRVDLAVLEQLVAVEAVGGLRAVPLRPTRRHADRAVLVAVQELADVRRVVARVLQPDGQRPADVEVREAAERLGVAEDVVVVGVLAGLEGRAGGAAERPVGHVRRERRALLADQLPDAAHVAHRVLGLVVAHQDDDVRPLLVRLRGAGGLGGRTGRQRQQRRAGRNAQRCQGSPHCSHLPA